jgi:hypothetical protein
MMTQQLQVSILAAPLSAIDRRMLSQAWYSALHLAKEVPEFSRLLESHSRQNCIVVEMARNAKAPNHTAPRGAHPHRARAQSRPIAVCGGLEIPESSGALASRSPLARAIENAFARPRASSKRATFSMGRGSARIHVVLQTKGARSTLVALCRPELRDLVARALMQARIGLAARGLGLELSAKGEEGCF